MPLDLAIAEWRDGEGKRFFTGIMRDISARKADEARRTLLAREVDHRAKNALAVVQSVLRLTPRDEPGAFAAAVEARVAALGRVHSLLAEGGWSGADLRAVAERELAPYAAARHGSGGGVARGHLAGRAAGPARPGGGAALRHGAARVGHQRRQARRAFRPRRRGRGALARRAAGPARTACLRLRWTETGGPPVAGRPRRAAASARA